MIWRGGVEGCGRWSCTSWHSVRFVGRKLCGSLVGMLVVGSLMNVRVSREGVIEDVRMRRHVRIGERTY